MPFDYPDQPVAGFLRFQGDVEVDAFTGDTRIVNITVGPTTFGPVAAKTVFANATNASASPTFVAGSAAFQYFRVNSTNTGLEWSTLSGHASTSISYTTDQFQRAALTGAITASANSNTTAFGVLAAKSVLANATNASAVPAALAGSAAFQHLRVNSANTGLEWAVLTVTSPITLTSDNIGFDQTVALGNNARVAVSKNSGATVGTRRRINFIEGSNVTITVADDAGNEEVDVTIASSGSGGSGGGTLPDGINLTATNETMEVAITGGGVADWEASFVDMLSGTGTEGSTTSNNFSSASNTVVAAPAASTQRTIVHASLYCITGGSFIIQKDVAGTDIVLIGPLTLAAGERAEFSEVGWKVYFADGSEKVSTSSGASGSGGASVDRFEIHDDFRTISSTAAAVPSATDTAITISDGLWNYVTNGVGSGYALQRIAGTLAHPGILQMQSGATTGSLLRLTHSSPGWAAGTAPNLILFEDIETFTLVARSPSNASMIYRVAMADNPSVDNGVDFIFDTSISTTLLTVNTKFGTAVISTSTVAVPTANTFFNLTANITPTTVEYKLNGSTIATHSSTMPTGVALTPYILCGTRTGASKVLDVDLFYLRSRSLSR